MPNRSLKILLFFGSLMICGVLIFQSYWLKETWRIKNEDFNTSVTKALRKVAEKLADVNKITLDKSNLVQKRKSNYYSVNVNSAIDAHILEDFLVREFDAASLNTLYEYAIYDCANDSLIHQNFCNLSQGPEYFQSSENLPKFDDLIYYFVVNFPDRERYLINDLKSNLLFSLLTVLSILFFMYAVWLVLKQQKVTDLQKEFINNMTHEFKTPISSIKIASEVILGHEAIKKDTRINKYAGIIKDQNERLNNQVEKVLNIARLEKDEFKLNLEKIELTSLLGKVMQTEKIKFENKGGDLILKTTLEDQYIYADKLHLTNVLTNILDNALKYCRDNPLVTILMTETKEHNVVSISDNGIGIDSDQVKKIFGKFYRVSTGNVHNVKGFGLGLYYVKNISDAHGWKLRIDTELKKGTNFIIEIPKYRDE